MMKAGVLFGAGVGAVILTCLLGLTTSGIPANPFFQSVTAQADAKQYILTQTTASVDQKNWIIRTGGSPAGSFAISTATDAQPNVAQNNALVCTRTGIVINGCTLNGATLATLTSGSYTATVVGCTTSPTITVLYTVIGGPTAGMVVVRAGTNSCTSNTTSLSMTGAPAILRPTSSTMSLGAVDGCGFNDNGVSQCSTGVSVGMDSTGTMTFSRAGNFGGGWTGSGNKAIGVFTYAYPLQ